MLEKLAQEYLSLCERDFCCGDPSVGIGPCPFYEYPDVDVNGGCQLEMKEE